MRHQPDDSRLPAPFPLLAAALLIGWSTGCAALPGSLSAVNPRTPAVVAAVDDEADSATPAPPVEPPADPLPTTAQVSPASATAASPRHRSPATQALIVEELALSPADERVELAAEWVALDDAMVEQVIRIRRMVRQLDAKSGPSADAVRAPTPVAMGSFADDQSFAAAPTAAPITRAPGLGGASSVSAYASPEPGRVIPPGPHQLPVTVASPQASPLYDPRVVPAAYVTPAPPADRGGAPRGRTSPLFPGLPPAPAADPAPTQAPLEPPGQPAQPPTRVAEALPPPAALLTPGATSATPNEQNPYYDPGPTGFGTARPAPGAGADDFEGRLDALELAARRRADRAAEAVRSAAGPEEKAIAERGRAEAEIHLRLLNLIAGEHGRALEAVPGLPPAEQEFWQHTFWALSTELDTNSIPDAADRATHAVAALRTAAVKLSERANLSLKDVNFCHRVDSFGNVQTFDRDEFTPNEPVLIYAAVENFTSERTLEGRFRTVLRSKVEIFRDGGTELVETLPLDKPMTVDLCDNHRQDYFLIYELKIPARIGLGPHVLKLTVEDTLGNATAETELNFTVK